MNAPTPLTGMLPTHAAGVSHAHESAVAQVASGQAFTTAWIAAVSVTSKCLGRYMVRR